MKKLTTIIRHSLMLAMLTVSATAWSDDYYLWYNNTSNDSGCENYNNVPPFKPSSAATASSSVCTWTGISLQTGNNFIYLSSTNNKDGLISLQSESTPSTSGSRISSADCNLDYGGYKYLRINTSGECTATIVINVSTKAVTVTQTSESVCKMHLQYPFNGSNWTWVEMVSVGDNIHFTYSATYQASRCGADISNAASDWNNNKQYYDLGVACAGMTSGVSNVLFTYTAPDANCTRTGGTLTMTSATAPEVYMGEKLTKGAGEVITGSVYLAQTGGSTVTDITVYYSLGATPTSLSPSVKLTGPFSCGNLYSFTVDDFCAYGSGDYQFMAVATNSVGSGSSDVVVTSYECCHGAINDFTISTVSDYVLKGDNVGFITSMTGGGAEPEYAWSISLDNGSSWEDQKAFDGLPMMYYVVPSDVLGGSDIKVKVVATGSNCEDTRTLIKTVTVCSTPAISGWSASERTPAWTDADISATVTDADKVDWTVTPTANILEKSYSSSTASAKFRGGTPKGTTTTYTITINATEDNCSTSTSDSIEIEVTSDADGC